MFSQNESNGMLREPDNTLEEHDQMSVMHISNAMAWLETNVIGGGGGTTKNLHIFHINQDKKSLNL